MDKITKETEEDHLVTIDDKAKSEKKVPTNTDKGQTLLCEAIQREDLVAIKKILTEEEVKISGLMVKTAVEQGSVEIVKMLLDHGWSIDNFVVSKSCQTALFFALQLQIIDMVRFLVNQGANVSLANKKGESPLLFSCFDGNLSDVKFLIESGANLEAKSNLGHTPLHKAAMGGHNEIVQFLIEQQGVEKETIDCQNKRPLDLAFSYNQLPVAKYLISVGCRMKSRDKKRTFFKAMGKGHLPMVKFFYKKAYNLNRRVSHTKTGLHRMAELDNLEGVLYLIYKGANINYCSFTGNTPLHSAASNGSLGIVQALIYHGANVDPTNQSENTPLMWAAEKGHLDVVKFLVEKGSSIRATSKEGQTASHFAAENGHLEVVQFLENLEISQ
jgi:ankyrin repeat protein